MKRIDGAVLAVALVSMQATGRADEPQAAATKPSEPTEISLEELMKMEIPVVEAASKYKQKITEAPSSVTIITSDEVKKYSHRTLADILRSVPGVYTTYDRNYTVLGVRGFSQGDFNNRVLLLVDGHRINNSVTDGAYIGTEFILDADLIDRVEVIRGPGSVLYGNNAFFGVINVITRKGRDMAGNGAEFSGEAASFDTYKGRVTYGNRLKNGVELLVSGSIFDSDGQDRLYYREFDQGISTNNFLSRNNGVAEKADDDLFKSFFGNVAYQDFSVEGAFSRREKRNPTALLLTDFDDRRLRTEDDRSYVDLKYAHEFPEIVDVTAKLYYDRHDFDRDEPYGGMLFKKLQGAEWWGTELQLTKRLWERVTVSMGGEYRDDFRQERKSLDAQTGAVIPNSQFITNRQDYGVYVEGDFAAFTNLHLNAGVRYDHYGDFDAEFNPRLAAIYNPIGQAVFKAIYGTAFRAPNFLELYSETAVLDLKPEKIHTYELVYEQGIGSHLRSSVAGFYNRIDNLIRFNSEPGHQQYENVTRAESDGVELALDAFWPGGMRGRASYTFQETEDKSARHVLSDSPKHLAKLNLSVPLWKEKLFAGLEYQYVSRRTTTGLDPMTGTEVVGAEAAGYSVVNVTLFSQNLVKGLELSASVYNLL
ncbi:MAG: TonB-dependent receptor, partial [Verrucomicrobia bacterium]